MRILVVDDHALIRQALRSVLVDLRDDAVVVEAADAHGAVDRIAKDAALDLILLDPNLPDRNGYDLLGELRGRHPEIPIVMISARADRKDIAHAMDLGAVGFIPKSAEHAVMLGALRLILAGGIYVPPEILPRISAASIAAQDARPAAPSSAAEFGLTDRQLDVLTLMMEGKSNKAICRALAVAEPTVKNHVSAILKALKPGFPIWLY